MDTSVEQRIREAREAIERSRRTIEVLDRVRPANDPSAEDIAALHELHAEHERRSGREDVAAAAENRARAVRERWHGTSG